MVVSLPEGRSQLLYPGKTNQAARAGSAHQEIATLLNNLAVLHIQRGRLPTAQTCYEQALTIFKPTLGPEHPSTRAHGPAVTTSNAWR